MHVIVKAAKYSTPVKFDCKNATHDIITVSMVISFKYCLNIGYPLFVCTALLYYNRLKM